MAEYNIDIRSVDDIPSIQNFEELQARMKQFSEDLNTNLTNKRHEMINEKQVNQLEIYNLKNEETKLNKTVEELRNAEVKVKDQSKQAMERLELQKNKVDELSLKQQKLLGIKLELSQEIDELTKSINESQNLILTKRKNIQTQLELDFPEYVKYETYLGLKINAISDKQLRFNFFNLDQKDINREFWIELNWGQDGGSSYLKSDPELTQSQLDELLGYAEDSNGGFLKFLRLARNYFKKMV